MPQLNVNNIDNDLLVQLNELAANEGASIEDFIRGILRKAVKEKQGRHLATKLTERFSSIGLEDDESIESLRGQQIQSPDFGQ